MDPEQIRIKVTLVILMMGAIEIGIAFLSAAVRESTPDHD